MNAAALHPDSTAAPRGAARLLVDCRALGRVTGPEAGTARARLERELGAELAALLVGALAARRGRRPALLV